MARFLRQNTAVTILIGQLFNWSDSKTLLSAALGGNGNFDPTKLTCTLSKGSSQSTLTLSKTGGDNDMNLVNGGMATLGLTAANVNTSGDLIISLENATAGDEVVFPCKFEFTVLTEEAYDTLIAGTDNLSVNLSSQAALDVSAECSAAIGATGLEATADFIKSVLEADAEVDTSANPWQLVIKHKTTGAELIRKDLKDVNGVGITSSMKIIGQHKEPN